MPEIVLAPLEQAVKYHGAKTPVGSKLRSREWQETVPVQIREVSQASAGVESARVLQHIQDGIGDILGHRRNELGGITDRSGLMRDIMDLANQEGIRPSLDSGKRGTIEDIGSVQRTELIYEMQTGSAYGYAHWKTGQDPDLLDAFPAQELVRIRDAAKPRDWDTRWAEAGHQVGWSGAAKGVKVALKNSPIWAKLSRFDRAFPPFDFGSGMWVEDVDLETAVQLGLLKLEETVSPQDKPFAEGWESSVKDLSPELRQSLHEAFPERVVIEGDVAKWKPAPEPAQPSTTPAPSVPSVPSVPSSQPATQPAQQPPSPPQPQAPPHPDLLSAAQRSQTAGFSPAAAKAIETLPREVAADMRSCNFAVDANTQTGYYKYSTKTVILNSDPNHWASHPINARHESGHHVHYTRGWVTDTSIHPLIQTALDQDLADFKSWAQSVWGPNWRGAISAATRSTKVAITPAVCARYGLQFPPTNMDDHRTVANFCDMVCAVSNGKYGWGHNRSMMRTGNSAAKEAFANSFAAIAGGDTVFQSQFKNTVAAIRNLLNPTP